MELRQFVRDLIRLGVELRVRDGHPVLHIPDALPLPAADRARRAATAGLDLLSANRDDVAAVWRDVATAGSEPVPCTGCGAMVWGVPLARQDVKVDPHAEYIGWAFCESLYCPFRTDERAAVFQQRHRRPGEERDWVERLAAQFQARHRAENPDAADPVPD